MKLLKMLLSERLLTIQLTALTRLNLRLLGDEFSKGKDLLSAGNESEARRLPGGMPEC
jgi:hypothetical protein